MKASVLSEFSAPSWQELPDIELYMDQVLAIAEKYFGIFSYTDENNITSSMLNNYVKQKAVPPPEKKRYNKEHLSRFLMICVLKRVLSIAQIKTLFDSLFSEFSAPEVYTLFVCELESAIASLSKNAPLPPLTDESTSVLSLRYAVRSFAFLMFSQENLPGLNTEEKAKEKSAKKESEK